LATRGQRRYRSKQAEAPWYLITNLDSLEKTLKLYESRLGIEAMFKDCKTGGYNIEKTKVSEPRFLALVLLIAIAYSLNTIRGQQLNILPHRVYICRLKESNRSAERHSDFWIGTYGTFWVESMDTFSELAFDPPQTPEKPLFLQRVNGYEPYKASFLTVLSPLELVLKRTGLQGDTPTDWQARNLLAQHREQK